MKFFSNLIFGLYTCSRSQCIINIRRGTDSSDAETDEQSNSAVLSVVDLAGAEREKRTGNQVLLMF